MLNLPSSNFRAEWINIRTQYVAFIKQSSRLRKKEKNLKATLSRPIRKCLD